MASQLAPARTQKIGEILVSKQLVDILELEQILAQQLERNKKVGELLIEEGLITESDLNLALKEQKWRREGFWVID